MKGRVLVETLIASGLEGKPAVVVKYPIEFDKLIELPEWLAREARVCASVRSIRTQVEQAQEEEDALLQIQTDIYFDITANVQECNRILLDAYALSGSSLIPEFAKITACRQVNRTQTLETIRGTVIPGENDPAVGSIIASHVLPNVAEISCANGRSRISGLFDVRILYMPAGSDRPAAASSVLEFSVDVPQVLEEDALIVLEVVSAEASALMGDRVDMKISLGVLCESRIREEIVYVRDIEEGETIVRRPGYVISWPQPEEDAWSIAKRYKVDSAEAGESVEAGKPLVLRI